MKIKENDKVLVIAGKYKGKTGKVMRVISNRNKVVVEKINIRTRHIKKTPSKAGERIQYEAPIDVSNVMFIDPKKNKPTRIGYKIIDKKKYRVSKITGEVIDQPASAKKAKK